MSNAPTSPTAAVELSANGITVRLCVSLPVGPNSERSIGTDLLDATAPEALDLVCRASSQVATASLPALHQVFETAQSVFLATQCTLLQRQLTGQQSSATAAQGGAA